MLDKITRWVKRNRETPDSRRTILISSSGFSLTDGVREIGSVQWSDVDEIRSYKTDDYSSDTVWLEFRIPADEQVFAVSEENVGFWQLVSEVKRVFPTSVQNWENCVIQPPFAQNLTVVYRRT